MGSDDQMSKNIKKKLDFHVVSKSHSNYIKHIPQYNDYIRCSVNNVEVYKTCT